MPREEVPPPLPGSTQLPQRNPAGGPAVPPQGHCTVSNLCGLSGPVLRGTPAGLNALLLPSGNSSFLNKEPHHPHVDCQMTAARWPSLQQAPLLSGHK